MWPYILTFIAVAVFPLALAGYGGHLATLALPEGSSKRTRAIVFVWALAIIGIVVFGISQVEVYRSDNKRDAEDRTFRGNVLGRLQAIIDEPNLSKRQLEAQSLGSAVANAHRRKTSIPPKNAQEVESPLISDKEFTEFPSLSGGTSLQDMNPTISVVITALAMIEHPTVELNCSDECVVDSATIEGGTTPFPVSVTTGAAIGLSLVPNSLRLQATSLLPMKTGDTMTIKLRSGNDKLFFVYGVRLLKN